jgi:hypothetical protein
MDSSSSTIIVNDNERDYSTSDISYGTPIIAFDFDQQQPQNSSDFYMINRQQIIFILIYTIVIPIVLFIVSRIIRCLRRRGVISENSEECIFNECQRHVTRSMGILSSPRLSLQQQQQQQHKPNISRSYMLQSSNYYKPTSQNLNLNTVSIV